MTLSIPAIESAAEAAIAAIAVASNLDDLKTVKIEHVGDKSPIARLNQGLGALEPSQRAEFGKILGEAKSAIG